MSQIRITRLRRPVREGDGKWWIPAAPPHYMESMGPYDTYEEADSDRRGCQVTINTPLWRLLVLESV